MSRARLGLYVFARVSLFSNCFELTPAFNRVFIDNSLTVNPYSTNHICSMRQIFRVPTSSGNHGKPGKSQKKFHAWKSHGI